MAGTWCIPPPPAAAAQLITSTESGKFGALLQVLLGHCTITAPYRSHLLVVPITFPPTWLLGRATVRQIRSTKLAQKFDQTTKHITRPARLTWEQTTPVAGLERARKTGSEFPTFPRASVDVNKRLNYNPLKGTSRYLYRFSSFSKLWHFAPFAIDLTGSKLLVSRVALRLATVNRDGGTQVGNRQTSSSS